MSAGSERTPVDVAVGVLINRDGRFLLTSRPEGKVYAGYWEFLGITIAAAQPWKIELMDYAHARVRLHFCKVFEWSGEFEMREQQAMAWQTLPVDVTPVLPGTVPVLEWFASERGFAGPTHEA